MNFSLFIRRLHVYLSLLLYPWVLMYGVSSLAINHNRWLQAVLDDGQPMWTKQLEQPYERPVPEGIDRTVLARQILDDLGLDGRIYAYRHGERGLLINLKRLPSVQRVIYDPDRRMVTVENRKFQWNRLLIRIHERSGYAQQSLLEDAWAVTVDIACLGFLILVATGLWMWWRLKVVRLSGAVAIAAGCASFLVLLFAL